MDDQWAGTALTRFGAAHPMAAESAVITPRAPMAPAKTCPTCTIYKKTRERQRKRGGE